MLTQQIPSQAPKTSVGEGPERDLEQESVVCGWRRKKGQPILATLGSPVTFSFGVLLFPFECSELSRGWEGQKQQQNQKWTPGPRGLVAYAVFVHLCCVNFSVCYPSLSNSAWDLVPSEGHCLLRGAMCGGIQLSNKASCLQPSLQLSLPHTPPHPTGFLILGPEQVTSCLPRALGVSPGACPPHTHCVPVVENYSLIRQRALASVPLPVPGLVPLPKCPSSLHLRDSTRLAPSFMCKRSQWALPGDSRTLCPAQSSLGDTMGSSVPVPKSNLSHLGESGKGGGNWAASFRKGRALGEA